MARAANNGKKIWIRPLASQQKYNKLNMEELGICIAENVLNNKKMSVAQDTTEYLLEKRENEAHCVIEIKEEHKQSLIRAVVKRIKRKMLEEEIWKEIQDETGYDHRLVWNDVRNGTMKKIMNLLQANDLLDNIPTDMQLSATEWLFFDLVLVHEDVDVLQIHIQTEEPEKLLNLDTNKEEPQCLQELFELVKEHNVENLVGDSLTEAWKCVTIKYNSQGRNCTPMLLQLRWYQLKRLTRSCFRKSYVNRTGLTVLQIGIAVEFNNIITQKFPTWETLIHENRVILSEKFESSTYVTRVVTASQPSEPSTEPPILLLTLAENQTANALDDAQCESGGSVATVAGDTDVIELKDDKKLVGVIQNIMDGHATSERAEIGKSGDGVAEKNAIEECEEEFKRRLVRAVAMKRIGKKNKQQSADFFNAVGSNCEAIWTQMRASTAKKVSGLLNLNDSSQDIPTSMRLSATEWLLFDLVLVHENIDVVTVDTLGAKCLRELFQLVTEYQVERVKDKELIEAWMRITLEYNSRGRQCSPMLLQLRWYQLKQLTRQQVYKPNKQLARAENDFLVAIATKYQKIITQKLVKWYKLVQEKRVILHQEFVMNLIKNRKWKRKGCDGWYLNVTDEAMSCLSTHNKNDNSIVPESTDNNYRSAKDTNKVDTAYRQTESNTEFDGVKNTSSDVTNVAHVVTELPKYNTVKFNETSEETSKGLKQLNKSRLCDAKKTDIIELDSDDEINEILREKADNLRIISQEKVKNIMDITQTQLERDDSDKIKDSIDDNLKSRTGAPLTSCITVEDNAINIDEQSFCDSDDEMDKLLQEKVNLMSIKVPKDLKTLENIIGCKVDEFQKTKTHMLFGLEVEEGGNINSEMVNDNQYECLDEADFDDVNIEFVDDGIKFEEGSNCISRKIESRKASSNFVNNTQGNEEEAEIDLKLLMNTTVYTKKLDFMEVFKFLDYDSVKDKRMIEYVESESKPVDKDAPKDEDIKSFREQAIPKYDKHRIESNNNIAENPFKNAQNKIKYSSWLLQKPKKRKYKSRQLFKNPDFNIQLKNLPAGFLNSSRNRLLLKECQPVTIDLHKAFENKLINGTMYLKYGNFKSSNAVGIEEEGTKKPSLISDMFTEDEHIKLAEHIRDLIATMTADNQIELDMQIAKVKPKLPVKRSKVINLPDKDQIRLINQSLLTAEISPRHQTLLNVPVCKENNIYKIESAPNTCSTDELPNKKLKVDLKQCARHSIYCCWAREKLVIIDQRLNIDGSKHMCTEDCCTCCCRDDLAKYCTSTAKILEKSHIDAGSTQNKKIYNNPAVEAKFYGEFDRFRLKAPNINLNDQGGTNVDDTPMGNTSKILHHSIESNNSLLKANIVCTMTKDRQTIYKTLNNHKNRIKVNILERKKSSTSVAHKAFKSHIKGAKPNSLLPKSSQLTKYIILPAGVNFVRLEDQQIAVAINPGVTLEPTHLNSLLSVCASLNNTQPQQHIIKPETTVGSTNKSHDPVEDPLTKFIKLKANKSES